MISFLIFAKYFEFHLFYFRFFYLFENIYKIKENIFSIKLNSKGFKRRIKESFLLIKVIDDSDINFLIKLLEFIFAMNRKLNLKIKFSLIGTSGSLKGNIGEIFQIFKVYKYDRGELSNFNQTKYEFKIREDKILAKNIDSLIELKYKNAISYCSNFLMGCNNFKTFEEYINEIFDMESYDFNEIIEKNRQSCWMYSKSCFR